MGEDIRRQELPLGREVFTLPLEVAKTAECNEGVL
jgi:hypothetical protein